MEKKSREGFSDFKGSDYQVLNSMKDLVRVIDKDGVIIFANKSMINSMPINPIGVNCYLDYSEDFPKCLADRKYRLNSTIKEKRKINGVDYSITSSPVRNKDGEVVSTVEVFRDISKEVKTQIDLINANKDIKDEIIFAKHIQNKTLPSKGEHVGLDLDYRYISSRDLSGDIIDCIDIDERFVGIYIADVVGHGIAASILTMFIRQTMRYLVSRITDSRPKRVLKDLNTTFTELNLSVDKYFTIFYGLYDRKLKIFSYANAGHNGIPFLISNDKLEELKVTGHPISPMFEGIGFTQRDILLSSGDELIMYTDGITETRGFGNEFYGEERLKRDLMKVPDKRIEYVLSEVNSFRFLEQDDDIVLVSLKVL
ncbi:MAG: SpoIIE family protein phosphatase [Finegoldia magna]|uniref:SpoIIE family protein phosphatase n=1 Tax=Finegoldia magna TaxID=1260 RepID=UPI00291304E0|nr:SpoIIE family protein phosphatase [Finegoldia magna]MDU7032267.1 SpoIIE family protein phosphatase [Finegoldia magna]